MLLPRYLLTYHVCSYLGKNLIGVQYPSQSNHRYLLGQLVVFNGFMHMHQDILILEYISTGETVLFLQFLVDTPGDYNNLTAIAF